MTAGEVAVDLASAWVVFTESGARADMLAGCGATTTELVRARGWAVLLGATLLDEGWGTDTTHAAIGAAALTRVVADT